MLAIPDTTVHRTKLADWLELSALSSPDRRIGFGTLVSAADLARDEQLEDISEEDILQDQLVLWVQEEISRRRDHIGEDYPFRIDDLGRSLELTDTITVPGSVYLFCLFLSHAHDRTILPKSLAPKLTNRVRNLFQACATVAAGGYVQGPAISFGFPRPDGATFLKALHRAYKLFGDGTPHARPRAAASKAVKDNGIDIIAWRRSIDNLPCTLYLIGQVASGRDWEGKSVVTDRRHFHAYWFKHEPGSPTHDAMFMPFGLEPVDPGDGTAYEEVLKDYMQSNGYRYGNLFYRDRIAKHAADGLRLAQDGETGIERIADIPKVVTWVNEYSDKLRPA